MRFKLLRGIHIDQDGTHDPNDVIESDVDLVGLHGREKFERLQDLPSTEDITQMTVAQLRAFAELNQINLGEAMLKSDILETIQGAMAE